MLSNFLRFLFILYTCFPKNIFAAKHSILVAATAPTSGSLTVYIAGQTYGPYTTDPSMFYFINSAVYPGTHITGLRAATATRYDILMNSLSRASIAVYVDGVLYAHIDSAASDGNMFYWFPSDLPNLSWTTDLNYSTQTWGNRTGLNVCNSGGVLGFSTYWGSYACRMDMPNAPNVMPFRLITNVRDNVAQTVSVGKASLLPIFAAKTLITTSPTLSYHAFLTFTALKSDNMRVILSSGPNTTGSYYSILLGGDASSSFHVEICNNTQQCQPDIQGTIYSVSMNPRSMPLDLRMQPRSYVDSSIGCAYWVFYRDGLIAVGIGQVPSPTASAYLRNMTVFSSPPLLQNSGILLLYQNNAPFAATDVGFVGGTFTNVRVQPLSRFQLQTITYNGQQLADCCAPEAYSAATNLFTYSPWFRFKMLEQLTPVPDPSFFIFHFRIRGNRDGEILLMDEAHALASRLAVLISIRTQNVSIHTCEDLTSTPCALVHNQTVATQALYNAVTGTEYWLMLAGKVIVLGTGPSVPLELSTAISSPSVAAFASHPSVVTAYEMSFEILVYGLSVAGPASKTVGSVFFDELYYLPRPLELEPTKQPYYAGSDYLSFANISKDEVWANASFRNMLQIESPLPQINSTRITYSCVSGKAIEFGRLEKLSAGGVWTRLHSTFTQDEVNRNLIRYVPDSGISFCGNRATNPEEVGCEPSWMNAWKLECSVSDTMSALTYSFGVFVKPMNKAPVLVRAIDQTMSRSATLELTTDVVLVQDSDNTESQLTYVVKGTSHSCIEPYFPGFLKLQTESTTSVNISVNLPLITDVNATRFTQKDVSDGLVSFVTTGTYFCKWAAITFAVFDTPMPGKGMFADYKSTRDFTLNLTLADPRIVSVSPTMTGKAKIVKGGSIVVTSELIGFTSLRTSASNIAISFYQPAANLSNVVRFVRAANTNSVLNEVTMANIESGLVSISVEESGWINFQVIGTDISVPDVPNHSLPVLITLFVEEEKKCLETPTVPKLTVSGSENKAEKMVLGVNETAFYILLSACICVVLALIGATTFLMSRRKYQDKANNNNAGQTTMANPNDIGGQTLVNNINSTVQGNWADMMGGARMSTFQRNQTNLNAGQV